MYIPNFVHDKSYAEFVIIFSFHHVLAIGMYFLCKKEIAILSFTYIFSVFLFLEDLQNLLITVTFFPQLAVSLVSRGYWRILQG